MYHVNKHYIHSALDWASVESVCVSLVFGMCGVGIGQCLHLFAK